METLSNWKSQIRSLRTNRSKLRRLKLRRLKLRRLEMKTGISKRISKSFTSLLIGSY